MGNCNFKNFITYDIFTNLEGTFKIIVLMDAVKIRLLWANIYINMCMKLLELQGSHIKVSKNLKDRHTSFVNLSRIRFTERSPDGHVI